MLKYIILLSFVGLFFYSNSFSQDPIFTQPFAGNVNLNASLAGCDTKGRLTVNYRNQWYKLIGGGYQTTTLNYYQYLKKLNGYGGIHIERDLQAGFLFTDQISGFYNQNIKIKELLIRPSILASVNNRFINSGNLIFGDQIDAQKGFEESIGSSTKLQKQYFNINIGSIFYFKKLLLGYSMANINQPDRSFDNFVSSRLPIRHNLQASYQLDLGKFALSPYGYICMQGGFNLSTFGLDFMYNQKINLAISTRTKDNVNFIVGYHHKWIGINYSYDFTINKLGNDLTGGTHEFALFFKFWNREANKNFKEVKSVFCR